MLIKGVICFIYFFIFLVAWAGLFLTCLAQVVRELTGIFSLLSAGVIDV